jgi:hypothetical protein
MRVSIIKAAKELGVSIDTLRRCQRPHTVVLEDLNVQGMLRNHKLARAVVDVAMFKFCIQFGDKAKWYRL